VWPWKRTPRRPRTLEEQLGDLASCGVRLLEDATVENLLEEWSRENFETEPYRLLLCALGNEELERCDNIWHFDTECIEDQGDYARIAERLRTMAGDDLPLEDIEDHVDVEGRSAWIAFTLDGERHQWTCAVEDDWVDPTVLSRFAALLASRATGRKFTYLDLGGQDCLLGCFSDAERKRLRDVTRLPFEWLT
jgi:hypothetical protein